MKRKPSPQLAFDFGVKPQAPPPSDVASTDGVSAPTEVTLPPPPKVRAEPEPAAAPTPIALAKVEPKPADRGPSVEPPAILGRPSHSKPASKDDGPPLFAELPAALPVEPRVLERISGKTDRSPPRGPFADELVPPSESRLPDDDDGPDSIAPCPLPDELFEIADDAEPPHFDERDEHDEHDEHDERETLSFEDVPRFDEAVPAVSETPWAEAHPLRSAPRVAAPPFVRGAVFVVPTERHVERFAVAGYSALTFPSMEERLLARLSSLSVATTADERAALASVFDVHGGVREICGMEVASPRFYGAFLDALDDIARDVGTFERARGNAPDVAARRIEFVARVERQLDEALARSGLVSRRRLPLHLAERVAESSPEEVATAVGADAIETRLVVDLAPRRLLLIRALEPQLASLGGRATVCLPMFDRPFDSERVPDPLEMVSTWALRWLEDAPRTVLLSPRLGTLDATVAAVEGADELDLGSLEIRLAASVSAEAHAVADAVAKAIAAGAHVDAIAVGYGRRDDVFLEALRRAFAEANIVAHGLPQERSVLPAFLFDSLAMLDRNDARALTQLFSSPFVDLGLHTSDARRRLTRLAHRLAQTPNVVAESARKATLVAVARAARPGASTEAALRDTDLVDRAFSTFESFPAEGTIDELARATLTFFSALGVPVRVSRVDVGLFATDELDAFAKLEAGALARDARAWEAFEAALGELVTAATRSGRESLRLSRARFFEELAAVYVPTSPLPGATRSFAVRVAKLGDLADEELDLLVVASATAAGLGAPPPSSPFVSAEVLRALGHEPHVEAAKWLAGLALASSRASRVALTACEGDDEGASSVSHVLSFLMKRGVPVLSFGRAAWIERPLSALDARVADLLGGAEPEDESVRARVAVEGARERFFLTERRPLSPEVGVLSAEVDGPLLRVVDEETGRHQPLALTGLERLAECPFRGFSHVVLGAREAQEDSDLPNARDEGTRLHGALAAALTEVRAALRSRPPDSEVIVKQGERAAARYLLEVSTQGPLEPVLDARVMHVVRAVLLDAARDERWIFEAAEQAFGEAKDPASWPALVLGDDELRLRGRIDRVDVGRLTASARVVDYKRGSLADLAKKIGKTALQVPLYAMATRGPTDAVDVRGIYFSLRDEELLRPNEKLRGEEAVVAALANGDVERTSLEAVRRVRLGDLAPRPDSETRCRTCALSGGCRRPRFAMPAEEEDVGGFGSVTGGSTS